MHRQARTYIKSALVYLLAAFLVGGLLLVNQGLQLRIEIWAMLPVYYHLLTVGWLTQLICGVALWMFPPLSREQPRGNIRLGWVAYGGLNGGLLLRAVAEPLNAWRPQAVLGWMLVLAALLQLLAIWLLVAALWPRVKGRPVLGAQAQPAQSDQRET
jgi:hypothetical protein